MKNENAVSTPTPEATPLTDEFYFPNGRRGVTIRNYPPEDSVEFARSLERRALRWIPVGERLPDEGMKIHKGDTVSVWVFVRCGDGIPEVARIHWPTNSWCTPDKRCPDLPVTHWMPIPELSHAAALAAAKDSQ